MGGELVDDRLFVFWAEMVKDPYDPDPPDGLGWHPNQVFLAGYDALTMERLSWESPRNHGVDPIYGYAVSSDAAYTYLFGNTFEQNMFARGRVLERTALGDQDVPGACPAREDHRVAGVPHRRRLVVRARGRQTDHRTLLCREPDAASLSRRSVGSDHCGRRLLGRCTGDRCRRSAVGAVDDRAVRATGTSQRRPQDEHVPRPPTAVARPVRIDPDHRLEQRPQHAA